MFEVHVDVLVFQTCFDRERGTLKSFPLYSMLCLFCRKKDTETKPIALLDSIAQAKEELALTARVSSLTDEEFGNLTALHQVQVENWVQDAGKTANLQLHSAFSRVWRRKPSTNSVCVFTTINRISSFLGITWTRKKFVDTESCRSDRCLKKL